MSYRNVAAVVAGLIAAVCLTACKNSNKAKPVDTGPFPTYSIGGTVTGLTGTVTLQNSNGSTVAVTVNGAFEFAAEMLQGNAYNVTVVTPPNSQTCTVVNGAGTVGVNDITNIAVTCTANPNLLHVTVSGLGAGKSVGLRALADGGSADLTVTSNGSFTFAINYANGAEYEVLLMTQPLAQTCTIVNPEGEIDAAIITNVGVTCINSSASGREWTTAGPVSMDQDLTDANFMDQTQVGYDAAGNALAVWRAGRVGDPGNDIAFSRYVPGAGWSASGIVPRFPATTPEGIEQDNRGNPKLAVAPNGDAVVIMNWNGLSLPDLAASFYDHETNTWTDLEWIYLPTPMDISGHARDAEVSMDSAGNVLVVFQTQGVDLIQYCRYKPGAGWITPVEIGKLVGPIVPLTQSEKPTLGMNANGDAVVVWRRRVFSGDTPLEWHLVSSRYDMATDTWSDPLLVDQDDPLKTAEGVFFGKDVLVDSAGNATAVWTQYDGARLHVMYNRLTGNTWGTAAAVETGNDTEASNAFDTHAAIDGNGNIMAMWLQNDSDEGHYIANRYVPGTGWGTQQVIGDYSGTGFAAASTEMKLVSNSAGDVIALWTLYSAILEENQLAPYEVFANEYNGATHLWGVPDVIDKEEDENEDEYGEAMDIAVAIDAQGNAVAVWRDQGSPESGIRAARFE